MDHFARAKFVRVEDPRSPSGCRLEVRQGWSFERWIIHERTAGWRRTPSIGHIRGSHV
jgi:hypothetical protein